MDQERIIRAVAESVVDRCLKEIERDPKRGVRSLADLCRPFVKEKYQRRYLDVIEKMEADGDSPYYVLLDHLVKKVDHGTIKTVGLNMGLGSWRNGVKTIRRLEAEQRCRIPWALTLHLDRSADLSLYRRVVGQGKENGIFTYLLQADAPGADLGPALELIRREPSCTFLLLAAPEDFSRETVAAVAACHHLVPAVDTQRPGWEAAAARLESSRCLYGVWRTCGGRDGADEVLSGRWLERVTAACCPSVALCAAAPDCPEELGRAIEGYVRRTRGEQVYPLLVVDLVSDYFYVDDMISPGGALIELWPDGTAAVRGSDGAARRQNLGGRPLEQLWREE